VLAKTLEWAQPKAQLKSLILANRASCSLWHFVRSRAFTFTGRSPLVCVVRFRALLFVSPPSVATNSNKAPKPALMASTTVMSAASRKPPVGGPTDFPSSENDAKSHILSIRQQKGLDGPPVNTADLERALILFG